MRMLRGFGVALGSIVLVLLAAEMGDRLSVAGVSSYVSSVKARVGRPLTPVSVAGVARRSTRRCATGVYNC